MRYLAKYIQSDLKKKMVFLTGPRQSGKTTLAKGFLDKQPGAYLNWDSKSDRQKILKQQWYDEQNLLIFDEIHKYSKWKNFVKGIFDTQKEKHHFLITGSAKLDIYKKGQDSMLGRFFTWRLHPLCLSELKYHFKKYNSNTIKKLMTLGGFPEPFFEGQETYAKRWRLERLSLVFRQDIQELESVRDISILELFHQSLTERVGSEIVLSNIARDLEIAPKTAKAWLNILEKTYSAFVVLPYSKGISRAITKIPKVYFYDNGEVSGSEGARFENLVATHLLKKIHFLQDLTGDKYELCYLRDKEGHEIDFVIVKNLKPVALIEAKVSEKTHSKSFYYYKDRIKVKTCVQLVLNFEKTETRNDILVVSANEWLSSPLDKELW